MEDYTYRKSYVEKDFYVRNNTRTLKHTHDRNQSRAPHLLENFSLPQHEFENLSLNAVDEANMAEQAEEAARKRSKHSRKKRKPRTDNSTQESELQQQAPSMTHLPTFASSSEATKYAEKCLREAARMQRIRVPQITTPDSATNGGVGGGDAINGNKVSGNGGGDGGGGGGGMPPQAVGPNYEAAGLHYQRACDALARYPGLYCTQKNAEAHTEYARNLNRRGLTAEAEYHLRASADIWRMMGATSARRYADVLLYIAVIVDRLSYTNERLQEAEHFYKAALAIYRMNKLSDTNVDIAIDQLGSNLKAQGRADEIHKFIRDHFLGTSNTMTPKQTM